MKNFSEYQSIEEVARDMFIERLIRFTREGKEVFPKLPRRMSKNKLEHFKTKIIEAISESPNGKIKSYLLFRKLRGDNYPDQFKIAIRDLVEAKKIREEKLVTGNVGRPCIYYYLFEF